MQYVEFDVDEGLFRATFDGDRDPASLAVVALVAIAADTDPGALSPLHSAIDAGPLEELFPPPDDDRAELASWVESETEIETEAPTVTDLEPDPDEVRNRTSFQYEGFDVTVFGTGRLEVKPTEPEPDR